MMTDILQNIIIVMISMNVGLLHFKKVSATYSCLSDELKHPVAYEMKLDLFPMKFLYDISPNACYEECHNHNLCHSVNYDRGFFYCELLEETTKTKDVQLTNKTSFVYMELDAKLKADQTDKKCGIISCNHYSTCVLLSSEAKVCVETECSERYPAIENGFIEARTFSPITASYACDVGYSGVGDNNRITCKPGGKWSPLSYRCELPVHGAWGEWGNWNYCSVTCGGGAISRVRVCDNPIPMYGGDYCQGEYYETEVCNTANCPVDGRWGHWSDWSYCTATCYGTTSRSRHCNNPTPMYGGRDCIGPSSQENMCYSHGCN